MKYCVWCEVNPVVEGDVLCPECKRDEEDVTKEIQQNKNDYINEDFQLDDGEELPF